MFAVRVGVCHAVVTTSKHKVKSGDTKVEYQVENQKTPGSKVWERYKKYKSAKTLAELKN